MNSQEVAAMPRDVAIAVGSTMSDCRRGRRIQTALFIVQALVLAVGLALCFINLKPSQEVKGDTGIFLLKNSSQDHVSNLGVYWKNHLELRVGNKVQLSCAGPYVAYFYAHIQGVDNRQSNGKLLLMQDGKNVATFNLTAASHSGSTFKEARLLNLNKGAVSVILPNQTQLSVEDLYFGLHYLLGAQCFEFGEPN